MTSESESSFTDSSSSLFSQYLSYAEKHDKEQTESWKAGADGTLVFVRNRLLFRLVIFSLFMNRTLTNNYCTILIADGTISCCTRHVRDRQLQIFVTGPGGKRRRPSLTNIQATRRSLQRDPCPDHSLFNVYLSAVQYTADSTASLCGLGKLSLVLSLVISLFCSLLATLQQRWARRYLQVTQPHVAIHERARIRSYFAEGLTRFRVSVTVEAIPALLHISVFLFLAGLIVSLFTIHHIIAYVVLAATAVCSLVHAAITVMPVICHDSPYTSPFSAPAWYIPRKTALAVINTIDRVMDFLGKYSGFVCCRKYWTSPHFVRKSYHIKSITTSPL